VTVINQGYVSPKKVYLRIFIVLAVSKNH